MKRVLMATSTAAVLLLAGCAGGDESVSAESAPSESAPSESTTTAQASPTNALAANEEVREACRTAVTERLPGAEFPTRGTLRASSTEGGRLFTVSGTAQADGSGHPYTCSITVAGGELTVDTTTVDGV